MAEEMLQFERLKRALTNLSQDDLLKLLKAIDDLMPAKRSDPAFKGQTFQAEGTFYKESSEQHMTLDEMLTLIQEMNPAELQVLSHLAPYYFNPTRYSNGQKVSASWGTRSPLVRYSSEVWRTVNLPDGISLDDFQQRGELAKSFVALLKPAQDAEAAGDNVKAVELFDQAVAFLKEHGLSGPEFERLRELFLR